MAKKIPPKISKSQSLRVLMVEDLEDDVLLIMRELKKGGYNPVYERVETATAMKKALQEKQWDIILCDYKLPKFNVPSAIALLKETNIDIPLIIVSGTIGEETAVECMRLGAHDYIMKNNLSRLCPAIARELEETEVRNKQKRAEETIMHSEKRFKALYQESPIPTFTWQKKGDDFFLVDFNHAASLLTKGKASDFMGRNALELYRKRPEIIADMLRCFKKQSTFSRELVSQDFAPERFLFIHYSYIPPDLIIIHAEDITERKRAEEATRESEERFRFAFENANTGVCLVDLEGNLTRVNNKMSEIFGYTKEELEHMTVNDIAYPEDIDKSPEFIQKSLHGKMGSDTFEKRYFHKKGHVVTCEVSSSLVRKADGAPLYFISHIHDITDRKRLEEILEKEREELKLIIDSSPIIVFYKDKEGKFIRVNRILAEALNMPEENFVGKTVFDLYSPQIAQGMTDDDREVFQSRRPKLNIIEQYESASGIRWVQTDKIPIFDKRGVLIGLIAFAQDITERKKAEEALHKSEENFHISLDNSPLGVRIATAKGETLYANQAVLNMYGYENIEELRRIPLKERYTPESYADFQIRKQKRARGEFGPSEYEISIVRKNGEIRHIQVFRKEVIWNSAKQFQIIYQDITKRKNAEDDLQKSEEKYRNILENIEDGYYEVDLAGNFTFFNDSMCRILGYPREEMTDMNNRVYTNKLNAKKVFQAFNEVYRTGKPSRVVDYEIIRKDGTNRYVETSIELHKDSSGKLIGFKGVVRDISEQKRAEEKLLQSEEKYRSIVENTQEGIYQSTLEGRHITLNHAFAKMLGYESSEEVMTTITDIAQQLYVNPDDRKKLLRLIEEKGSVTDFETEFYRKDGSKIWVSINMHAVRDDQGHLLYYQGIDQDITEKKKMEAERQENIERLRKSLGATINAMAVTVETRDPYTAGHQRRVADLTRAIATEINLGSDLIDGIRMAGMIHDIGKISIPSEILTKPTQLTNLEFNLIKTHPQSGYNILKDIDFPWPIARIVLEHHERMNGSGYPNGLKREQILLESRILAIADVVEAISSHRPYRPAHGIAVALDEISKNRGSLYDPDLVDACLRLFREKNYNLVA